MASTSNDETGPGVRDTRTYSWKRNLYALWIAQTLALIGFTLRDA
jgi:hypothetical protein